jgi:CheY-like chemotaxis protein
VKSLVEAHGGSVAASSEGVGRGATFTITLPVLPLRVRAPQTDSSQRPGTWKVPVGNSSMLDGLLVLVVDDEEDARLMLAQMLSLYGAKVIAAGSAAEALTVLSRQQPDVMVSDIGMPGEDGYELIRKVRSGRIGKGGHLPAVALTAYAQPRDRMQALAAGFQHHVPKPADPNELVTVIASLTGRLHGNGHRERA